MVINSIAETMRAVGEKLIINKLGPYQAWYCVNYYTLLLHSYSLTLQPSRYGVTRYLWSIWTFLLSPVFRTIPVNLLRHVPPCHFLYAIIFPTRIREIA